MSNRPERYFVAALLVLAAACSDGDVGALSSALPSGTPVATTDLVESVRAASELPSTPRSASPSAAPSVEGPCPADMRHVHGNYCAVPDHACLEWNEVNVAGRVDKQQCKRYREPAVCVSKGREPMSFCMDTFEWPNQKGAIPRNLTSWQEAKDTCEAIGKRLCTDVEFTFACEGESMKPHVTGFLRDPSKCSYDRPYRLRTYNFEKHDQCLTIEACKAAMEAIDQRLPAGSMESCVSDHGVYDLNGNVNEWIQLPGRGFSKRAGLKGGWWGPVRDRCRPITTFHGESDYGYEVGFRCCKDVR